MFQELSNEAVSQNRTADKASQEPKAYSTPKLVEIGQAHTLVQGTDLYKDFVDPDGNYHDN